MADFFRSALGYIGNVTGASDNEFVGQTVELGQQKLRVKRLIAEGGCHLTGVQCYIDLDLLHSTFV